MTLNYQGNAEKNLTRLPSNITKKLRLWIDSVGADGLIKISKIPGYHDEPLKGGRSGQRSIRLNNAYRAIYEISCDGIIEFIEIKEVNKHAY